MYPVCDLDVDIRSVLPSIRVPTMVFHRRENPWIPPAFGRYLADQIPDARFIELEGVDHFYYLGDSEGILSAVQEFVTGEHEASEDDRVLATVLSTDIVGSTERAARIGDDVGGIAVHIGARIAAQAGPGEVLASSTFKGLVVGSGLTFVPRGSHALKGMDGAWSLFAAS